MEKQYYDGTKLLSLLDKNGQKPEIYICASNRSAGKTTYFGRYFVKRFLEHDEKFILLYRYNYELSDIPDKFFKELKFLFFPKMEMTSKSRNKNVYHELFLNDKSCGYAVAINNADQVKKLSHLFSDAKRILFDEFQSESDHYCNDEIKKFLSVHTSIARGGGEQVRYLPVFMLANHVSILNPYYIALGVSDKLQANTKFYRGDGFVMELALYENVAEKQKSSAFNRAFSDSDYVRYSTDKVYLNDRLTFIDRPNGVQNYMCTIKFAGKYYSLKEFPDQGFVYCDTSYDASFPRRFCVDTDDHDINMLMLKNNDSFLSLLRWYFEHGLFRFRNQMCKQCVFNLLSYK